LFAPRLPLPKRSRSLGNIGSWQWHRKRARFLPSPFWGEKATLFPLQRSHCSLPPFSDCVLRPRGPSLLDPSLLCSANQQNGLEPFSSFHQGSGCMLRSPYERRTGRDPRSGERGANRARFPRRGNRGVTSRHISRAFRSLLIRVSHATPPRLGKRARIEVDGLPHPSPRLWEKRKKRNRPISISMDRPRNVWPGCLMI
jgi:hypothetical protein